jgi:AcrR family transcriptional regulator
MPTAFTEEERAVLSEELLKSAGRLVQEQSARKITVEQLTNSVGISKGAFYLFYPSKEHLFYALLRRMHANLYAPALRMLEQPVGTPAQQLTDAILEGCKALDESGLCRFWEEDAPQILRSIPVEERGEQTAQETEVFHRFLCQNGGTKLPEEEAIPALESLILTVPMRKELGTAYPRILLWMAQGICEQIF